MTAVMQTLLFRLLWKLHGSTKALFAVIPVVFDGWLMYIERVSYMENALMVLIVTGFLLYQRALEKPSALRFALAGAVIGFAGAFKQTGVYVLLAVLLCWLVLVGPTRGISCWPPSRLPSWSPTSWLWSGYSMSLTTTGT